VGDTPAANENYDVEYARNDEKVTWEDQLVVETMGNDSQNDGQSERYGPEGNCVAIRKEHFQCVEVVFESFFFQTA
jgi:hypothetical protein